MEKNSKPWPLPTTACTPESLHISIAQRSSIAHDSRTVVLPARLAALRPIAFAMRSHIGASDAPPSTTMLQPRAATLHGIAEARDVLAVSVVADAEVLHVGGVDVAARQRDGAAAVLCIWDKSK